MTPVVGTTSTQARKLGVAAGSRVVLVDAPAKWNLEDPPEGTSIFRHHRASIAAATGDEPDVTIVFVIDLATLDALRATLVAHAAALAPIWICWPRRAGGHESDLTDNHVRAAGLSLGLVDNKVAAVDTDWSGLRFARRRQH